MKRLFLILLFALLASSALAEQRVVMYGLVGSLQGGYIEPPGTVKALLSQGWHIVSVSTSSNSRNTENYLIIFILERPDQPKP